MKASVYGGVAVERDEHGVEAFRANATIEFPNGERERFESPLFYSAGEAKSSLADLVRKIVSDFSLIGGQPISKNGTTLH